MTINAWIQLGCERREVEFDVTDAEIKEVGMDRLEAYISDLSSLVITSEVLNPRTKRKLVTREFGLGETISRRRFYGWDA